MAEKSKGIVLAKSIYEQVVETGLSVNAIIENQYSEQIAEMRKDKRFENKSATKLALIDNGIRGNMKVSNLMTTDDNKYLFPVFMADLVETTMAQADIMQYLISGEVEIEQSVAKAPTLDLLSDENKKNLKKSRVAEGGEFPLRQIAIGEATVNLYKKGLRLGQTYEAARRMTIDLFSKALGAVSTDIVRQNVDEATRVLESSNLYDLGTTATADIVTNDELLEWAYEYSKRFGYSPTTIVAPDKMFLSLLKMNYNSNDTSGVNASMSLNFPTINLENLNVIPASVAPVGNKNRLLMYNKDYSLSRYVERGSTLQEQDNNIQNQTNEVVLSEVSGYANFVESVAVATSA